MPCEQRQFFEQGRIEDRLPTVHPRPVAASYVRRVFAHGVRLNNVLDSRHRTTVLGG